MCTSLTRKAGNPRFSSLLPVKRCWWIPAIWIPIGRDPVRIAAVAKEAGVKRIDYLLITHYHGDHVGGVPELARLLPITNFIDHGPCVETSPMRQGLFHAYVQVRDKGNHILAKPGDRIPIEGIDVQILTAAGQEITSPLAGAGEPNPICASIQPRRVDKSENAQSVGTLITYGKFRMIDLGDLTWNKEMELACPDNKIGTVDVYLSTHHGLSSVKLPRHRACAAATRGHRQQRRNQGRRAGSLADDSQFPGNRGRMAVALLQERHPRRERARAVYRQCRSRSPRKLDQA